MSHPLDHVRAWLEDATRTEPDVPDAAALATAGADGRPRVRMVLIKQIGPEDLIFYTNLNSIKAGHLRQNPAASVCFHWKSLAREVIVEGDVEPLEDAVADAYWASRPRGSQIGGWASRQSDPLESREELDRQVARVEARFAGEDIPRPPFWSGFRLRPRRVELWQGREDRLHERTQWELTDAGWVRQILYP